MSDFIDKTDSLTPLARKIICDKATEYPFTGVYNTVVSRGTYLCKRCGLALFRSTSQFTSSCGWPSFDDEIAGAIKRSPDSDGMRTEILCARCDGHLGHVFIGEHLTAKNLRHCVNSASVDYVVDNEVKDSEEAIVAGGCFWGVEHYLRLIRGVLKAESGYTGGHVVNPNYEEVCHGNTGHYEAVRVVFDCEKTSYHQIIKRFFEIHDPTQRSGQGPDIGHQYQSAIFCYNQGQKDETLALIKQLQTNGFEVVTRILEVQTFWPAEGYHQEYYLKHHKAPYCHNPVNRFQD